MGAGSSAAAPAGVKVLVKQRYQAYLPQSINRKATLTPDKVKRVHDHWSFIADENDAGMVDGKTASRQSRISVFYDAFYDTFFRKAPSTREMFDGNMVRQSRALVKMVSCLCNLEVTEDLIPRLEVLADRHVEYGCQPIHFEAGVEALEAAVRAATRDQDPEEMEHFLKAWHDLYSFVCLIVIPRTVLRLEESTRGAGPHVLRASPTSGTRLKKPRLRAPSPRAGFSDGVGLEDGRGGGVGSPRSVIGKVQSLWNGATRANDGVWVGEKAAAVKASKATAEAGSETEEERSKMKKKKYKKRSDGTVPTPLHITRLGSGSWTRGTSTCDGFGGGGGGGGRQRTSGSPVCGSSGHASCQSALLHCPGKPLCAEVGLGPRSETCGESSPRESRAPSRISSFRPTLANGKIPVGASLSSMVPYSQSCDRRRNNIVRGGLVKLGGAWGLGMSKGAENNSAEDPASVRQRTSARSPLKAPFDRGGAVVTKVETTTPAATHDPIAAGVCDPDVGDGVDDGAGGGRVGHSLAFHALRGELVALHDEFPPPANPTSGRPWEDADVSSEIVRNTESPTPRSLSAIFLSRRDSDVNGRRASRSSGRISRRRHEHEDTLSRGGGAPSVFFGNGRGLLGKHLDGVGASRPRIRRWPSSQKPTARPEGNTTATVVAARQRPPPMPHRLNASRRVEPPLRLPARAQAFVKNFSNGGVLGGRRTGLAIDGSTNIDAEAAPARCTSCVPREPSVMRSEEGSGLSRLDEEDDPFVSQREISSLEALSVLRHVGNHEELGDSAGFLSPPISGCPACGGRDVRRRSGVLRPRERRRISRGGPPLENGSQEEDATGYFERPDNERPKLTPLSLPTSLGGRCRAGRAGGRPDGGRGGERIETNDAPSQNGVIVAREKIQPQTDRKPAGDSAHARGDEVRDDGDMDRLPPSRRGQEHGEKQLRETDEGIKSQGLPRLLPAPLPRVRDSDVDALLGMDGLPNPEGLAALALPGNSSAQKPGAVSATAPASLLSPSGDRCSTVSPSPTFSAASAGAAGPACVDSAVKEGAATSDGKLISEAAEPSGYRRKDSFGVAAEETPPLWQTRRLITTNLDQ